MQVGDEPDLRLALPDAFIAYPIHLRERLARIGIRALGGHRAFG
ncbi:MULTISPECIES: hypothetical protein [unclassified Methylobacterium]|nr:MULTISPECIES: hypothetical protein [Methylobacterium]WFT77496.1 hypothetical protein QA634_19395 [Methylobacterium nodulans]